MDKNTFADVVFTPNSHTYMFIKLQLTIWTLISCSGECSEARD